MPEGGTATGMDPAAVSAVGREFEEFAQAIGEAGSYAKGDGLTPAHFGGRPAWQDAGGRFLAAVQQMAASLELAAGFTGSVVQALKDTVAASVGTDETNAHTVTTAGKR